MGVEVHLDKEKDIIVDLYMEGETLSYVLRTPNHATGNLITNLARLCGLSLSFDADGLKIVKELVHLCGNRFEIYAMVPTHLTSEEVSRLKKSGVGIRISIEPVGMGLYKSFAYEIFKRRPSVVIALDGNSAGTNVIQEARNGKRKARIFINRHATSLYSKARTLRGYTAVIENADASEQILEAVASV